MDPIQQAVDMGSRALDFVNAPLVLDYVHLRFSCTVPGWLSSHPFRHDINAGFSEYFPLYRSGESGTGKNKGGNASTWTVLLRCVAFGFWAPRVDPRVPSYLSASPLSPPSQPLASGCLDDS